MSVKRETSRAVDSMSRRRLASRCRYRRVELRRLTVAAIDDDVIPCAVNLPLAAAPLTVAASGANGVGKGNVVIEVDAQTVFEGVFQRA